ncbi:MAG TPA: enolase C-terminal domain-like protein [Vicinamibacteria bacterium]|nr:enolase C-terminal domain-like protein [Vicinamibacteria bacterium]
MRPFGFKGGYMSEIWQTAVRLESEGARRIGLGSQSVLWSDAAVFAGHAEAAGNALMYAMTERGLALAREAGPFRTPLELQGAILDATHDYGRTVTGRRALRRTFTLNALVPLDNAAWLLYAAENGFTDFDAMVPEEFRPALAARHRLLAAIPLMAYAVPVPEIRAAAAEGFFFMKVKIGQPGTQEEMLEKDKARLSEIHAALGSVETPHTRDGKLPYYFDANGRYESKATLLRLLDHARAIGAFDRIAIVEEPFPEELEAEVGDLGVRVAADESAHTDADAARRIELGYGAIALKPIAKTLSMTLRIARLAHEKGVPCFCADLTVNPILVDWNKTLAARLAPLPGLSLGLVETNGHQNYRNWEAMRRHHPCHGAPWTLPERGVFRLDDDFYARSGGIFLPSEHYEAMFRRP